MNAQQIASTILEAAPVIRNLSRAEAKRAGHDTREMTEFPIRRMEVQGSRLDFEEGPRTIWILNLETEPAFRRQGRATRLYSAIRAYAQKTGKTIVHGAFTDQGERYIKPLIGRHGEKLTRAQLSQWLLSKSAWDMAYPLDKKAADWIARHAKTWVLVDFPVINFMDTAPGGKPKAPLDQPIVVALDKFGDWKILDGQHRYSLALEKGIKTLPAFVPEKAAGYVEELK